MASAMVGLCTVGTLVSMRPARSSWPRIAMMPPARCTSSMWTLATEGATLHKFGTRRDSRSMSLHREIDAAFLCRRQQVQHRIGRAAHRDVQGHRVLEDVEAGDA